MNLKNLLTTPLQQPLSRGILTLLFVIAVLGFIDAGYLAVEHYTNSIPPCTIGGCETVLTSDYSVVAGVPVALGGTLYYLAILILLMIYLDSKSEKILRGTLIFTTVGFLVSIYFLIIQAWVINAYCIYCIGSAITSTALFATAIYILKKYQTPHEL